MRYDHILRLEQLALLRRYPWEMKKRSIRLFIRRLCRPSEQENEVKRLCWDLLLARNAERQRMEEIANRCKRGGMEYIHRSMLCAIESFDQGDYGLSRRHMVLGIQNYEASDLPLYGMNKFVDTPNRQDISLVK